MNAHPYVSFAGSGVEVVLLPSVDEARLREVNRQIGEHASRAVESLVPADPTTVAKVREHVIVVEAERTLTKKKVDRKTYRRIEYEVSERAGADVDIDKSFAGPDRLVRSFPVALEARSEPLKRLKTIVARC